MIYNKNKNKNKNKTEKDNLSKRAYIMEVY